MAAVARAALECARARRACSEDPVGPATRERLERFLRDGAGRGRGQVRGLTWDEIERLCKLAEDAGLGGVRDAAMIGVMADGLIRVSEVSGLDAADVTFLPNGTAEAVVRRSKTDQYGRSYVAHVGAVAAERHGVGWRTPASSAAPCSGRWTAGGACRTGVGPDSVRAAIKRRAAAAGIEGRVSGHSLRIGTAQRLAEAGTSLAEMQQAGRWRSSSMPARYVRGQEASRSPVARLRAAEQKGEKHCCPKRRWYGAVNAS